MPSPSANLRRRLDRRAKDHIALANNSTPDHLRKTPSEKKSDRARQKDLKRAGLIGVSSGTLDCHTCQKRTAGCVLKPDECRERTTVEKCKNCRAWVRHYVDNANPWELCPACKVRL